VHDVSDFSRVFREASWIVASVVAALAVARLSEDKGGQTAFVSGFFYLLTGVVRLGFWMWRRRY
jgi:hypothetical protein